MTSPLFHPNFGEVPFPYVGRSGRPEHKP